MARSPYRYRYGRRTVLYAPEMLAAQSDCNCRKGSGSQLEQKIKENPFIFIVGAVLAGYFLAKNADSVKVAKNLRVYLP